MTMPTQQELAARNAALEAENQRLVEETAYLRLEVATLESIGDGILVIDRSGDVVKWNQLFIEMWQLTPSEMQEHRTHENLQILLQSKLHSDTDPETRDALLAPVESSEGLLDFTLNDETVFEQYSGIKRVGELVEGHIWTFRDVTARREMEQELNQSRLFLQRILRSAPIVLFIINMEGIITTSQGSGLKQVGLRSGELVGQSVFIRYQSHPFLQDIRSAMGGKIVRGTHDFEGVFYDIYLTPLRDDEGLQMGVLGISLDVTDQKRVQEIIQHNQALLEAKQLADKARIESEKARKAAEEANLAKSTFLANMSHELRTPLNSIIGFSQFMVHDPSLNPEQQEYMTLIMSSSEHLLTLINDILEMSKIEAGKQQLNVADFDLWEMLESLDSIYHANALNNNLEFKTLFAGDLPRYVSGDRGKLRQILVNLLSNAIKFTNEGTIRFIAEPLTDLAEVPNDYRIRFKVEDTGVGIQQEEMNILFEPFLQTESGQTTQSGTGLGLSISKKFAELMGGDIQVESVVGEGSCFTVEIQLAKALIEPEQSSKQSERVIHIAEGEPTYRILVVDDKWENRLMLVRMLQSVGFEVKDAENGKEALQIWKSWKPHLTWMDMRMPVMDGYEATRRIRQHPEGKEAKIIALTASAFDYERVKVMSIGCDDYLAKPFRESDLFDLMVKHLGVKFDYAEANQDSKVGTNQGDEAVIAGLNELADSLRSELEKAAANFNLKQVQNAAKKIADTNEYLAERILSYAREFDFRAITDLLSHSEDMDD